MFDGPGGGWDEGGINALALRRSYDGWDGMCWPIVLIVNYF